MTWNRVVCTSRYDLYRIRSAKINPVAARELVIPDEPQVYAKVNVNDTQGKFMTVSHETLDNCKDALEA